MKALIWAGALAVFVGAPAVLFYVSSPTELSVRPKPAAVGPQNEMVVEARNPHGIRSLSVSLEQGTTRTASKQEWTANRFLFWRQPAGATQFKVRFGAGPQQGFKGGPAKLVIEAVSNDFRGQTARQEFDVVVNLDPPSVRADGEQHYINQGGAELVLFTVSGYWTEAGVRVGRYKFRSYPVPGAKSANERFSLFAWPWDVAASEQAVVYASNPAGAVATARFWQKVKAKPWRKRELTIAEPFIGKVVAELDPQGQGSGIERFLRINRSMRESNNETLARLREQTVEKMLWTSPFEQLSNTQVEALFADVRSYIHEGKKVDEQVHLGFDLSKVARAPVEAANSGVVVLAEELGIYGKCVVVDHGYGLQSIYAHLSEISVKKGQKVGRREVLGRTGATGMAGGDHLHYSMQVDGVQVNPIEWWDPKWIENRILSKLPH